VTVASGGLENLKTPETQMLQRRHEFLVCLLWLAACRDNTEMTKPDGGLDAAAPSGNDAGQEAGPPGGGPDGTSASDTGTSSDAGAARQVRFALRNETAGPIYIQNGDFWTLWRNGQILRPEDTCEYCDCQVAGCAVCGRALQQVVTIAAGTTFTWDWAGYDYLIRPRAKPPGIDCEEPAVVTPGPLEVRVTYSLSKVDMPPESTIGAPVTLEKSFDHPPSDVVVVIAR
jgi:hypothetical protein